VQEYTGCDPRCKYKKCDLRWHQSEEFMKWRILQIKEYFKLFVAWIVHPLILFIYTVTHAMTNLLNGLHADKQWRTQDCEQLARFALRLTYWKGYRWLSMMICPRLNVSSYCVCIDYYVVFKNVVLSPLLP